MVLDEVAEAGSTQDVLKARAAAGAGECALLARRQTAGHGRLGRVWTSCEGNLHLSVLLRPEPGDWPLRWPGHWSVLAGVALVGALQRAAPGRAFRLKWPNDVLLDTPAQAGGKLAGVLVDAGIAAAPWLVLGFGVNLAWAPEGLGRPVASLAGSGLEAPAFARVVLQELAAWRRRYAAEGFEPVRAAWLAAGPAVGAPMADGAFAGLREDGALLVTRRDGVTAGGLAAIVAGEVA